MKMFKIILIIIMALFMKYISTDMVLSAQESDSVLSLEQELTENENVTLDFKDADIKSVLKIIAYKSGVNIVATPEVMGVVTVKLQDVPWENALDTIVKTYGFGYEWLNEKVIMVSTLEKLAEQRQSREQAAEKEPLDTQTFALNFVKVDEIEKTIEKLITERGKITIETRTNILIVTDTKSNLIKVGKIIKMLDKVTSQVMIEAKIIETTLGDTERMGIDWTTKITARGSKRPTIAPFSRWDNSGDMYPIPQYSSEVDADTGLVTVTTDFPFKNDLVNWPNDAFKMGTFPMAGASEFTFGTLDFSEFQSVLEILNTRTDTNVVSNPRIATVNNKQAKIIVGTKVPIPIYEYSKEAGTRIISGYKDLEVGIKLLVTPNINEANFITLDVEPSVEEITGWTGPNNERPIISTRSAQTKVMIKDGETLVIGGLISNRTVKYNKKFPVLGHIPLLGWFFSKKEDTVISTDLIIFITPRIVEYKNVSVDGHTE